MHFLLSGVKTGRVSDEFTHKENEGKGKGEGQHTSGEEAI